MPCFKRDILVLVFILSVGEVFPDDIKYETPKISPVYCERIDSNMFTYVLSPDSFRFKSQNASESAQFMGTYENVASEAIVAMEYAFQQWSNYLKSTVPIKVYINSGNFGENVLASASPSSFKRDFNGGISNVLYPVALAEKIAREELNGSDEYDIEISFSNDPDLWYYGVDGNVPPGKYDFVSVIMHELGHGLGFIGTMDVNSNNLGEWGFSGNLPTIFDVYIQNGASQQLIDLNLFNNPSSSLKSQLTSNSLYFYSKVSQLKNPPFGNPRLYAPATFNPGSSIYHLNDATYPAGTANSLMTHATGAAEVIHSPGPLSVNILEEMGWVNTYILHEPAKDIEDTSQAVIFNATVSSDNPPATARNYVFYKADFEAVFDSILMDQGVGPDNFEAELFLGDTGTYYNYYIKAYDNYNRPFTDPRDAPLNFYSFHAGFDKEVPEVYHEPIPFMVVGTDSLEITATVTDNLGVDTVIVYYNINFSTDTLSFGMVKFNNNVYKGYFNFKEENLQLNDIVEYRFFVRDKSQNKNIALYNSEQLVFEVEETADIKSSYIQDFDAYTSDFYGVKRIIDPQNDINFEISRPEGFDNGCLHTPAPYRGTGLPGAYYEYIAQLRFPIRLNSSSYMRFDEIVLVEPGETGVDFGGEGFWDYVIVEASKDSGKTWVNLQPGYDARKNPSWYSTYSSKFDDDQNSTAKAIPALYVSNYINVTNHSNFNPGDVVFFRFRLYSDSYAVGWGWAIDNLDIQDVVNVGPLPFDNAQVSVYPNPAGNFLHVEIHMENPVQNFMVSLQDIYGRNHYVYNGRPALQIFNDEIDMSQLPKGIYFLVLDAGKDRKIRKVVKN